MRSDWASAEGKVSDGVLPKKHKINYKGVSKKTKNKDTVFVDGDSSDNGVVARRLGDTSEILGLEDKCRETFATNERNRWLTRRRDAKFL